MLNFSNLDLKDYLGVIQDFDSNVYQLWLNFRTEFYGSSFQNLPDDIQIQRYITILRTFLVNLENLYSVFSEVQKNEKNNKK